ncbi:LOW QUALITY PROTEIN: netrin receptor DCC-like [Ammospiza maritima maritima]
MKLIKEINEFSSPSGKKFRSKPQLARYLGNAVDLSSFDFRTGKMMPSKLQKNKQKLRNDALNPNKGKPDLNTTLPIRQTASIFKQPVTKVTNHPGNKVRSDPQRMSDQPKQAHLEAKKFDFLGEKKADFFGEKSEFRSEKKGIFWPNDVGFFRGVGPGASTESLLSAVASALHTSSAPITGQNSAAVEKNPGIWLNTAQPLCRAFVVTHEDIRKQEERVQAVRKKLEALPLGPSSVLLSWADPLAPKIPPKIPPKSQPRFYTVRWRSSSAPTAKYKTLDTTALTLSVPGLRAHTSYEFSVMATRGRRSSPWSMTALATTHETAPSSPPKDLTVISREGKFRNFELSWQPPVEANGKITGYTIFYSPIKSAPISEWIPQAVGAERLSQPIPEALLDSGSFFRVQARNSKGPGPLSEAIYYRSPKGKRSLSPKEPPPPDLWIHPEEMELKNGKKTPKNSPEPQKTQNGPENSQVPAGNANIPQPAPEPDLGASTLERCGIGRRGKLNAAVSGISVPNLESPFPNFPLRPLPFSSLSTKILGESEMRNSEEIPNRIIPTACVRPTHPLRSFGNSVLQQAPFKLPVAPEASEDPKNSPDSSNVYEQDELSAQMASLEGLMKQLNAITGSAF